MQSWTRLNKQALRTAMALSREIKVIYVKEDEKPTDFCEKWRQQVEEPTQKANLPVPELVQLHSPYRLVVTPIVEYVKKLASENSDR
jgi:hypothetical protein